MKKYIFFIREYNDWDNIAPIVYYLAKNITSKICICFYNTDQRETALFKYLNEQVKTAVQTGGAIAFTDPNTVQTAANNFAPQDVTISANSILEGTKDLVIGSLATIDTDQTEGVAFTYKIAEAAGSDYALFEINSNN